MELNKLNDILMLAQTKSPIILSVAYGVDKHTIEAISKAVDFGIAKAIIIGDDQQIASVCNVLGIGTDKFRVVSSSDSSIATMKAIELVRNGEANAIMKGLVETDVFMKAILNKETGITEPNSFISHISIFEHENYHKLLLVSDVAIVPLPTLEQKKKMVKKLAEVATRLGIEVPKIAFIAATEKIIEKMSACADAKVLIEEWENGAYGKCECLGPVALDVALDKESANVKGIFSPVAGNADCLLFPNIESGNVFYKASTKLSRAKTAAVVYGTKVPTVLSSRGDSVETKLFSIALASIMR